MIEKGHILLIRGECYEVIGDYSEVDTPLNYELRNIKSDDDTFMVNKQQVKQNFKTGKWQVVDL